MGQNYAIFGAGPGGLYAAWRLLSAGKLQAGDTLNLYEWGTYDFEGTGTHRQPAGRICSHHYKSDLTASYIEIGGMRFIEWNGEEYEIAPDGKQVPAKGHRLVTTAIKAMGLYGDVVDFLTTDNPLYYLRGEHFYEKELGLEKQLPDGTKKVVLAPYNTPGNNAAPPGTLTSNISGLIADDAPLITRADQCAFYGTGTLPETFNSFVYSGGEIASNVGYWNVFYDQAGSEGFNYAADGGGYNSNVINWNAANASVYNGEFAPGGTFKTIAGGYSRLFTELYNKAVAAAADCGAEFNLVQGTRLHSIWSDKADAVYQLASADDPHKSIGEALRADVAFLAMPPESVELLAHATRYLGLPDGADFLNMSKVANYLESVIEQPSYKIAMFFDTPWWKTATYPPKLEIGGKEDPAVFGPTITDLPLRQVYYFGDNALSDAGGDPVYGVLTSYDDERFVGFWRGLELPVNQRRETATSRDLQPLQGGAEATAEMERMLLLQLAKVHYGTTDAAGTIPAPKQTVFMDWGLNPFGAGYHAWAAHYDICDVMQTIRQPAQLARQDAQVFLIGSAFSNDQAWVEGAFCTAESVLVDCLGLDPIINTSVYRLICDQSCS